MWYEVFKNGAGEICGKQPLKHLNFTWSILEYFIPYINATFKQWS